MPKQSPDKRRGRSAGVSRHSGKLSAKMRSRGIRMTAQRRIIACILEEAQEHLDADALFRMARRKDRHIHRATVYRTLEILKDRGLVDELDLMHVGGTRHYYELHPSEFHIHLVCTSCGWVQEPGGKFWEQLQKRVIKETGFRPEVVRLEIGGFCSACQRQHGRSGSHGMSREGR